MNAVFVIDKPSGLTSHDMVNRVRRILQQKSVGHLGTLDPLATGVLPVVVGNLTRLAQFYNASEKSYQGTIRFGVATDTFDAEGDPIGPAKEVSLSLAQVQQAAQRFRGMIQQTPPPFSAKKVHGVPAYKLARKKREVKLEPVEVEIHEFEIVSCEGERASFRSHVASGTYMRCVAHDLGAVLGCGAHLESLRRTRVAEFSLADALSCEQLETASQAGRLEDLAIHPRKLLPDMPSVTVTDEIAAFIRSGRAVNLPDFSRAKQLKVFHGQSELIAIATRIAGTLFHPRIVFASEKVVSAAR